MSLVSVIIPAYNQSHYLGEAILSVLNQSYADFEIIVVDDGSTDNTPEIARSFVDDRVRYVYQENRGLSAARNTGIRHSQGKYLTYLDSDDLFLPDKLKLLVNDLVNNAEIGFVAGQAVPIDGQGNRIGKVFDVKPPEDGCQLLLGNPLHVGSVMVDHNWQQQVGFFDETLRSYEDWDMWIRLARAGCQMGWVAHPVSLYRFHPAQMTRIGSQMTEATFAVLEKVFRDPTLPNDWLLLRDEAYSNANLRAAAQAYHAQDYRLGQSSLVEAVRLNPDLIANDAKRLSDRLIGWTSLPKSTDPLASLERVYDNLPDELEILREKRNQDLGQAAIQLAFEAYQSRDIARARYAILKAFRYQPGWIRNRGARSIFIHTLNPLNKIQVA